MLRYLAKKYNIKYEEKELTAEEIMQQQTREKMFNINEFADKYFVDTLWNTEEGKTIGVKIVKLTGKKNAVLDATVNVGEQVELPFEVADGWGEYKLTMTREDVADEITVTDIAIHSVPEVAPDAVVAPKANAITDGAVYSLSGVRQTKNPAGKGVYIANGKKVLKK